MSITVVICQREDGTRRIYKVGDVTTPIYREYSTWLCNDCEEVVFFKHGAIKQKHFAHKAIPGMVRSELWISKHKPETSQHLHKKLFVVQNITTILFHIPCIYNKLHEFRFPKYAIAQPEKYYDKLKPDITVTDQRGQLLGFIEIEHSHRRLELKELRDPKKPMIEISSKTGDYTSQWHLFREPTECDLCHQKQNRKLKERRTEEEEYVTWCRKQDQKKEVVTQKLRAEKEAAEKLRFEQEATEKFRFEQNAIVKAAEKIKSEKEAAEKLRFEQNAIVKAAEKIKSEKEAAEKLRFEQEAAEKFRFEQNAIVKAAEKIKTEAVEKLKAVENQLEYDGKYKQLREEIDRKYIIKKNRQTAACEHKKQKRMKISTDYHTREEVTVDITVNLEPVLAIGLRHFLDLNCQADNWRAMAPVVQSHLNRNGSWTKEIHEKKMQNSDLVAFLSSLTSQPEGSVKVSSC